MNTLNNKDTEMKKDNSDSDQAAKEVQCTFRTMLPEEYKVEESIEIQLETNSTNKDLTEVVRQMMEEQDTMDE